MFSYILQTFYNKHVLLLLTFKLKYLPTFFLPAPPLSFILKTKTRPNASHTCDSSLPTNFRIILLGGREVDWSEEQKQRPTFFVSLSLLSNCDDPVPTQALWMKQKFALFNKPVTPEPHALSLARRFHESQFQSNKVCSDLPSRWTCRDPGGSQKVRHNHLFKDTLSWGWGWG